MKPTTRKALALYLRAVHFYGASDLKRAEEVAMQLARINAANTLRTMTYLIAMKRGALPFGPGKAGPLPKA